MICDLVWSPAHASKKPTWLCKLPHLSRHCLPIQVREVAEHEPDCKVYFALTKCDLLEQLPGIGTDASHLEPSPQESGTPSNHCSAVRLLLLDSDSSEHDPFCEGYAVLHEQQQVCTSM